MHTQTQPWNRSVNSDDRLLTFAKTRTLVGLSRSKIYLLLAEHGFPTPVKIGRNNYFSELELQAWITEQLSARANGSAS
jgi:predicted DNA-binding transcriptional regulator AlpA